MKAEDALIIGKQNKHLEIMNIQNYHVLTVKFYGATNYAGSRIGIISERFKQRITISYDYQFNNSCDGAIAHLQAKGFDIVGQAEGKDCYYLISNTFEPLK